MFPIRKIVLFKHGVGYFERQKKVTGETDVDLYFKTSEMNDVLKSLTAVDIGGGSVASISYQAKTPVEKQLEQLSLHLNDPLNSLTELLRQAIGAEVALTLFDGGVVEGTVLGLEKVTVVETTTEEGSTTPTSKVVEKEVLNLLMEDDSIQAFPVLELESFVFKDTTLRHDLQHLLDVLINAKKKDLKKLTVFAKGEGERTLVASYVIEAPVWKTSYRLLLTPGKSFLQGWALIDNTQDEDWNGVTLTLVSGKPNAFTHDLYSPRFRQRPVLKVNEDAPQKPPKLEDVLPYHSESLLKDAPAILSSLSTSEAQIGQVSSSNSTKFVEPPRPSYSSSAVPPKPTMRSDTVRKIKPVDVFSYAIDKPVTVKRGQSALVPFLSAECSGVSCSLYNEGVNAKNPLMVVRFKNNFDVALDGGPMSIFDEETCIGEAMLETTRKGDEKFIPFGVEMNVLVTSKTDTSYRNVHKVAVNDGRLTTTRYRVYEKEYKFSNKGSKDIADMFLEHRFYKGDYELTETDQPMNKTENFYRFHIKVVHGAETLFTVRERKIEDSVVDFRYVSADQVNSYHALNYIDSSIKDKMLKDIIPLREKIAKENSVINTEDSELRTALSRENSARSEVYRLNNQSAPLTEHQKEQLDTNLKTMMEREGEIRKLKASLKKRRDANEADQTALDRKYAELKYSAELFQPPKAIQIQA